MLLSICRTCIQVQFDVSAPQTAPHLDDLFLHRERRELESGAPAALGEGAFAGTRLVRRFRPMDEPERGGRGLMSILCKPSATEIEAIENFARIDFARPPVHWGVEYNNLKQVRMTKHLTGVPPVSSPARALDPRTEAYLALGDTTFLRFYRTVAVNCNL